MCSDELDRSVVQVFFGEAQGLGVISRDYILTAAHCLDVKFDGGVRPKIQKCKTLEGVEFLAACLFVDAVSDLAVLDCPDGQEVGDAANTYFQANDGRGR